MEQKHSVAGAVPTFSISNEEPRSFASIVIPLRNAQPQCPLVCLANEPSRSDRVFIFQKLDDLYAKYEKYQEELQELKVRNETLSAENDSLKAQLLSIQQEKAEVLKSELNNDDPDPTTRQLARLDEQAAKMSQLKSEIIDLKKKVGYLSEESEGNAGKIVPRAKHTPADKVNVPETTKETSIDIVALPHQSVKTDDPTNGSETTEEQSPQKNSGSRRTNTDKRPRNAKGHFSASSKIKFFGSGNVKLAGEKLGDARRSRRFLNERLSSPTIFWKHRSPASKGRAKKETAIKKDGGPPRKQNKKLD